jgi:mannose-6-phosphate isomerase-like protein (cupin superfamily)
MDEEQPSATKVSDVRTEVYKDGLQTIFVKNKAWDLGLYFMEPGMTTIVFSLEETDDGTADEWYGPSYEFYRIVQGTFTVWYGKDATDLRKRSGPNIVLREGDVVSYPPGWKYVVQNTGKIPGSFFWGKTAPKAGIRMREFEPSKIIQ